MSFVMIVMMCRRVWLTDDNESAVFRGEDFDRRVEQTRKRCARDHVARRSRCNRATSEVDDAIEIGDDWIDVVRDDEDRHPVLLGDRCNERSDRSLVRQVKAVEWFVEE